MLFTSFRARLGVLCLLSLTPVLAQAADKKALVIEPQKKGFKELARGLRVTLKQNHNYNTVKETDFVKEAKKRGIGTGKVKGEQLVEVAKALGADLLVVATAAKKGAAWEINVTADATDGRGRVYTGSFSSPKNKMDRSLASDIARAIRAADAQGGGTKPAEGGGDMDFALDEGAKDDKPAAAGGMDLGGEEEVAIKVAPKALRTGEAADASEADEKQLAQEYEDDEFYEPSDELTDKEEEPRYVAPDGRSGLVVSAGYAMTLRSTTSNANNGTPPNYRGTMSPGVGFHISLFPRRFKEGGGIARDFGGWVEGQFTFMSSEYIANQPGAVALNATDPYYHVSAGAHYRHVFGNQEKSVAFGAKVGVVYDQISTASGVPFPTTFYVSPLLAAELEVPVMRKMLVITARGGVMPVTGVSKQAIDAFGLRSFSVGVSGAAGVKSTVYNDLLYLEAYGYISSYWNAFTDRGTSRFADVSYNDLIGGFSVAAGVAY